MKICLTRLISVALAAVMLLSTTVMPVSAETADASTGETIARVAVTAKPSVVGILNTMKAVRSTDRGRTAGTGFVYSDGIIITNAHVVDQAAEVKILYPDKTVETVMPERIFSDQISDVAVIMVKTQGLRPLPLANSDNVTVGQTVVAIGNPLGFRLGNSVSAGILSGTGRTLGSGYPFLQVDAPINPGNSGGPLFNLKGEVIGMNSAKMADIGIEGLGFAIPINTARQIAQTLVRGGKVERSTLGIALEEGWEAYFGVPDAEGVTIANIIDDGPAGRTALRPGDKLIKLDETPVYASDDVALFLLTRKPGDRVKITVKRRGQVLSAEVRLASTDELRHAAEEQASEMGGILISLSEGQIQEAAEFGRSLSLGVGRVNQDYFAISGSNYAILYTEYLYVARRISSAYDFGFTPGVGFQQHVAKEINGKLELQFEINGDRANFMDDAAITMDQEGARHNGSLFGPVTYTTSGDGAVVIASGMVRFAALGLSSTDDLTVTVRMNDGKTVTYQFTISDLR